MNEDVSKSQEENERLRARLKELGREKAKRQLAVDLINRISTVVGLENVVDNIIQILMEAIGGSNIAIYYETEDGWRYADIYGKKQKLKELDDPIIKQAIENRTFIKVTETDAPALQSPGLLENVETWVYPLSIGDRFFGAIRLEGMALVHAHYRANIDPFISYAALVLYHEVSNVSRLQEAYQEVKKAREELWKTNQLLKSVIDNSPQAILAFDINGKIALCSPAAERMYGWKIDEMTGSLNYIFPENSEKEIQKLYGDISSGQRIMDLEVTHRRNDSSTFDANLCVAPIVDAEEKVQGAVAIIADISERKQAEESLRESEERYRQLSEISPNAIVSHCDGIIEYVNPAGVEMFGVSSPEELIGKLQLDLIHPDDLEESKQRRQKIIEEGGIAPPRQHRILTRDGKVVDVESSGTAFKHRGKIIFQTIFQDITERKHLEEQLRQAYKMEAIGTLAGGIAHDFNNILTPIIVQSELALMDIEEKSPIRFNLQEVLKAGLRAKDLVKQILTFSRQSEQQPIPLKITPSIKEAIKLLRASLPTTIEIQLDLNGGEDTVIADPTQIHQVLMNLCTNAGHAMRDKGGILNVSLDTVEVDPEFASGHAGLEPGSYLKLAVSDTGHGISPEVLDRIFDPFFTTKDRSEGTGMGLAVVHGIIKSYGGEITVESELGKGTTFMIFFPGVTTVVTDEPEIAEKLPMGNERILLVDDEEGMVDALRKMLSRLGYQVVEKTSSIEALEVFGAAPDRFDLVITDQTMPNKTGMELAKIILSIRSNIPIILCTGFSESVNEESAKAMGISAFVMKPIVMRDIAHTIREVLNPALSKR